MAALRSSAGCAFEIDRSCSYSTGALSKQSFSLKGHLQSVRGEEIPIRGRTLFYRMESPFPILSATVAPNQMVPDLVDNT